MELAAIVERLAPVLGLAESFALVLDPDGGIVWVNDATTAGFGEIVGANVLRVVALNLRGFFRRQLDATREGGAQAARFDTVAVDRHGNQAAVEVRLHRLEHAGEAVGFLVLLRTPAMGLEDLPDLAELW